MKVNMTPNPLDVVTIHASQGDTEARQWEFELHNNGELIDTSDVKEQMVFKAYKGGTEQLLPENTSTPTTSPFIGDIKYPQGLLTDQEFTYRQSPTEEDGLAKITDIKGNTLVWNQLVQNGNFADGTNNWEAGGSSTISASNGELTVTIGGAWNNDARQNRSLVAGHKYLGTFKVKSDTLTNIGVSLGQFGAVTNVRFASTETLSSAYQTITGIATITESTSVIRCSLTANASSYIGQTFTIKDVMLFDLTQMGLDISNPSDFTSLFPLSYYSYNQGTLLSFMGNGIKTVGKNLVSNSMWEQGAFDGATGQSVSAGARIRTNQFIRVMENVQYSFTMESTRQIYLYRYDMNGNYLGYYPNAWSSHLSYTPSQNELIKIALRKSDNTSINPSFINDAQFQMEIGTATSYEPYTSSALSLPISTYFPTGMKSAGTVYDELTPTKAITRIGVVDLGSFTWSYNEQYQCFITYPVLTDSADLTTTSVPNFKSIYKAVSWGVGATDVAQDMMVCFLSSAHQLRVRNKNFTDPTAFKTAMNGVYLYYELATPTETSFTTASLVTENAEIPLSNNDGVLIGKCTEELSAEPGFHDAKIKLSDADGECYSNKLQLHVERSPQ